MKEKDHPLNMATPSRPRELTVSLKTQKQKQRDSQNEETKKYVKMEEQDKIHRF